jgi:16S rRNA (cytosine1402-N4)-methyltransferase
MSTPHNPVMLAEVLAALAPQPGELIIDGTFGAGGYSTAILTAADCRVLAFDRDPTAIAAAATITPRFPNRLSVINWPFGRMDEIVRIECTPHGEAERQGPLADGVVFDIGVSSMQLDQAARGFSFQSEGPLDMRMSQSGDHAGPSAADLVNTLSADDIADILFNYGDERRSRAIARAIVKRRETAPFVTTMDLVACVAKVLGPAKIDGKSPATRTFQALRIAVNDELGELARGLTAAENLLKPGGRLVVVAFHSLEDRIVKQFLTLRTGRTPQGSRHLPPTQAGRDTSFEFVNHRPLGPSEAETASNPRARSAKLRSAIRTSAAAWPLDLDGLGIWQRPVAWQRPAAKVRS